jgi:hypothetical protein
MRQLIISQSSYHDLAINASPTKRCHGEMLDRILDIMNYMVNTHSKVFFVRLDFRFSADYIVPPGNQVFVDFLENFIQNLKRLGLDPYRFWVREQSTLERPHYHVCIFLNGNKIQSIGGLHQKATELWGFALNRDATGLVWDCTKDRHGNPQENGIMIRRGAPDYEATFQACYYWASYLAKTRSKELIPNGVKSFGSSQIPGM